MAKTKTVYFCQNCGAQSAKWLGKCPACGEWNTYVEEKVTTEKPRSTWQAPTPAGGNGRVAVRPQPIGEIEAVAEARYRTPDAELNRVLGGGIVPGSLVLIGGEPGIGKSTLMLQIALTFGRRVLYVSGEESAQQIKMRAERLGVRNEHCLVLTETATDNIFRQVNEATPDLVVIDSIQTLHTSRMESAAGSVSQVRECTAELMQFAKESQTPVFLIGHITKEGSLAGPKVLEHMVDTVLQFEGDRHLSYRILRTTKNRFGSTAELGIYEMQATGLRQVSNPSEILISQRDTPVGGIAIAATLEGNRPLLIEIQSLVSVANYGTPQRSPTGFDAKRLNMLLAVLEKRGGFRLGGQDVFLNVAGGLRVEDPAVDLAVAVSVVSSLEETPLPTDAAFAAEVGLAGEVRAVTRVENRISEAAKLGFSQIFVSKYGLKGISKKDYLIDIKAVSNLGDVFKHLL